MLYSDKVQRLTLWTRKAVAVLVIGESVLVIWVFENRCRASGTPASGSGED